MKQPQHKWTPEEKQRVAEMLREGLSASQIGHRFGKTRNSVIGVVGRDNELREIGFARSRSGASKPNREISTPTVVFPRTVKPIPAPHLRPMEQHMAGAPMKMLKAHQCKFAVNEAEVGDVHLFCGADTDGGSWCGFHRGLAYRPYEVRRKTTQMEAA